MAKKRKLKKKVKLRLFLFLILVGLSIAGIKLYEDYQYKQTYEYKLLQINYSLEDTKILIKNLKNKELDNILLKESNENIVKLVSEKYFISSNLDRYLTYYEKNNDYEITKVVSLVNVNRDRDYYDNPVQTRPEQKEFMIVNKYHFLDKDYAPEDIIKTSLTYSYENNSLNETTCLAYQEMAEAAKLDGYTILIISSYRNYQSQEDLWNGRKALYGTRKADEYAARAGHSEHQTGYAVDVGDFYDGDDKFGETESYKWMINNSYKYGFILRYPKEKENITGYSYEPWHYRYVGKEIAKIIYDEQITFDEYYAYYIENVSL